jgi:hypothetical protein
LRRRLSPDAEEADIGEWMTGLLLTTETVISPAA